MLQRVREQRAIDIARWGSPMYSHKFAAIAAGANEYVDMETTFPRSMGYKPLTSLLISNKSAADLDLEINGQDYTTVFAGTIWQRDSQPVWSFRLTNNDAVAAAVLTVRANINKPPMNADDLARLEVTGGW